MKSKIIFFLAIIFLCPSVIAQKSQIGQTIEDILSLPEDEIDLGIACLVLAKDAYSNLNIEVFDFVLDAMATQINMLMQGNTDPEARIGMLNTYFYRPGWWNDSLTFTYDLDDLEANEKENQFLNSYLATRKGSCQTMPMLHLVIADRLNWPIYAVRSPKHFFCRYIVEGFIEKNIEATAGGGYTPDESYITDTGIPDKAIKNGVYMRTLSKKEYLASLLINNFRYFYERENDLEKAAYYLKLALSVDSTFAGAHWNLGQTYLEYAKRLEKEMLAEIKSAKLIYQVES